MPSKHRPDAWLVEKTSSVLSSVVYLADWLREQDLEVSELDQERVQDYLQHAISKLVLIITEEYRDEGKLETDWAQLLLTQGHVRFDEFEEYVHDPKYVPAKYSPSYQTAFDALERVKQVAKPATGENSQVRADLLECARELAKGGFRALRAASDQIFRLVDDQVVYNHITWEDCIASIAHVAENAKREIEDLWAEQSSRTLFRVKKRSLIIVNRKTSLQPLAS